MFYIQEKTSLSIIVDAHFGNSLLQLEGLSNLARLLAFLRVNVPNLRFLKFHFTNGLRTYSYMIGILLS
jgi:hypothetical protein